MYRILKWESGCRIEKDNYITFTKNKNEMTFSNNSKEFLSDILIMIFNQWKLRIHYLNDKENLYLAEMRDALLPDLMSGKIDLHMPMQIPHKADCSRQHESGEGYER